jgi:serine/threonine protein kinase
MGEVFRAHDARLGRDVAVKAIPAAFAADPERLARFEREARLLASLNHPNIAAIYGVEDVAGTRYLVLEFVEGETLETRLARGPLPLDEALDVARQVAAGVEAAHESGIVHRDLKPGNIMLTRSGAVKVLDFGLARGGGSDSSGSDPHLSSSPTMTFAATQAGVILGTAAYMSPEQARGKTVDRRTDVWSFGCILYEMLSGQRAFAGETVSDMVARILEREPDWSALPKSTPPRLVALLKRCLVKDARQRQRDLGDVRLELDAIASGESGQAPPPAPSARLTSPLVLAACAIALVALGAVAALGLMSARGSQTSPSLIRFVLAPPQGTTLNAPAEAEFSPDGSLLVFDVRDSTETVHLCLRRLASPDARILPGTENASLPFWSPDGRQLGFFAAGKLRKMALDGSPPADLCSAPDGRGASWSPKGIILFAPNNQGGLMRVPDQGGVPVAVTQPDTSRHERGHRYPQFLPDGTHFLYVAITNNDMVSTYAASLDGGKAVEVCKGGSEGRYAKPGVLLYLGEGVSGQPRRVLVQKFDASRLATEGDAHVLVDRANANNFGYTNLSSGPGGLLVLQHWDPLNTHLTWRDASGAPAGVAIERLTNSAGGALSLDGRHYAYTGVDPSDVFVADLTTGVTRRLTFQNQLVGNMVWSPDGRRIAFSRIVNNRWEAHVKAADGSGPDSVLFRGPGIFTYTDDWSRDDKWILLACSTPAGDFNLWRLPVAGGAPIPLVTDVSVTSAALSPDAHWVAYTTVDNGNTNIFVQSFPDPGSKYQVTFEDAAGFGWMPKGLALVVFDRKGTISRVDFSTDGGFHQEKTARLFSVTSLEGCDGIDPTTGRFLMRSFENASSLSSLDVFVGWTSLLSAK